MSEQNKPSIVFAHGIWADGSCFQKLIPTLQAEGHEVMSALPVASGPRMPPTTADSSIKPWRCARACQCR